MSLNKLKTMYAEIFDWDVVPEILVDLVSKFADLFKELDIIYSK
jgi:hypothetical protein